MIKRIIQKLLGRRWRKSEEVADVPTLVPQGFREAMLERLYKQPPLAPPRRIIIPNWTRRDMNWIEDKPSWAIDAGRD